MADEKKPESGPGSEVRSVIESLARGQSAGGHVTPSDIGSHPPEEDQPMMKEIHLFGVSNLDRAIFCRQLATLIEVGIPLLRALKMLSRRTPHPKLAKAIATVASKVEEGQSVSNAMFEQSKVFSPIVCNVVRVGEIGGILEDSLVRLAQIMESKADMNRKIFSALMYPFVALTVAFAVIIVILTKAVPVFTSVYKESAHDLPQITQFVINVSDIVTKGFWIWIPLLIAAVFGWQAFRRTPPGIRVASLISLRFPIVGRITRKIGVARFSRTLGGLLTAGVPLVEGLTIAADTNENVIISDALRSVQRSVEKGEKVGLPLARTRIFPPMVVDMISIGEETGTLDRMLDKIADIYDADVDSTLRGLSSVIEPLLIVFLGGIVIVIALAVMLPYFQLVEIV